MLKTLRNKKGFTLVELAIVLVIIGIILGAVLKGQELINGAKTKRVYSQYREILAAVLTYQDKYGKLPGDDNDTTLGARWVPPTYYAAGDGNGQIAGAIAAMITCGAATATETCGLWDHMRRGNIITGPLNGTNPTNAFGGAVGIAYVTVSGLLTNWIGMSNIPTDIAQSLDRQYDDGVGTTGDIRGTAAYVAGSVAPISLYFRL
jgi:prepilin-type N-terminal cleavage/methylation domain-containing protein